MKKLILAGIFILGVGLGYAYAENKATTKLEHQNKIEIQLVALSSICTSQSTSIN